MSAHLEVVITTRTVKITVKIIVKITVKIYSQEIAKLPLWLL